MSEATHFLVSHGGLLLFGVVFLEQIGLPLPTVPWLLGAGALWALGMMNPILAFGATVAAPACRFDLVLSWTPAREPRVARPLPHLSTPRLVRWSHSGHFFPFRRGWSYGRQVPAWGRP